MHMNAGLLGSPVHFTMCYHLYHSCTATTCYMLSKPVGETNAPAQPVLGHSATFLESNR